MLGRELARKLKFEAGASTERTAAHDHVRGEMRQALIVVIAEQPHLREAATRTAGAIARIGILADVARDIIPIGLIARATPIIMAALGPALLPLRPSPLG